MVKKEVKETINKIVLVCTKAIYSTIRFRNRTMWKLNSKLHEVKHTLTLVTLKLDKSHSPCECVHWHLRQTLWGKTKHSYIILQLCQPWPHRTGIALITRNMWPNHTKTPQGHYNGLCCSFSSRSLCCPMLKDLVKNAVKYVTLHRTSRDLTCFCFGGEKGIKRKMGSTH